jgi:hypothetical protein
MVMSTVDRAKVLTASLAGGVLAAAVVVALVAAVIAGYHCW